MSLEEEINARRSEIRSDGYPMSIGELISLYRDDELVSCIQSTLAKAGHTC